MNTLRRFTQKEAAKLILIYCAVYFIYGIVCLTNHDILYVFTPIIPVIPK